MTIYNFLSLYSAVLCGKVTCIWDRAEIIQTDKYDVQYTYIGGHVCVSAHLRTSDGHDETYVHDGTICGGGKVETLLLDVYVLYIYNYFIFIYILYLYYIIYVKFMNAYECEHTYT